MFLKGAVFMKAVNLDVKNDNSGVLSIREASTLKVQNGDVINESGTVNMIGTSTLEVTENLINKGNFNNESSSSTIVKKNVVNSGGIYNESIIEIGE